jgi:hypothetical protein
MKVLARIAVHLDPGTELEDFQTAARLLVAHQLVTERFPHRGALALVRRFEEPLRNEFGRLCHWRLDVAPTCARLTRRPACLSAHRPARTASQSRRPFTPRSYAYLCLVLAAIESLGAQTTISQLADAALRLGAGDDALDLDLTEHAHRRAFVDAVAWLEERGVLTLLDGETESFLAQGGDALYDVDADAASRLLVSPPSVLAASPLRRSSSTSPTLPRLRARSPRPATACTGGCSPRAPSTTTTFLRPSGTMPGSAAPASERSSSASPAAIWSAGRKARRSSGCPLQSRSPPAGPSLRQPCCSVASS